MRFREGRIEITFRAGIDNVKLQAKPSGRGLQVFRLRVSIRVGRIDEQSHDFGRWHRLMQQFQELWPDLDTQIGHACQIAARPAQARNEPDLHRIGDGSEHNGDFCGCGFDGLRRWRRQRSNQSDIAPDEIGGHGRQAIVLALRPALLDRQIPALAVTGLGETLAKCTAEREPNPGWARAVKDTDHGHAPGLCTRRERPSRRAAKQRDELASLHCAVPLVLATRRIAHLE